MAGTRVGAGTWSPLVETTSHGRLTASSYEVPCSAREAAQRKRAVRPGLSAGPAGCASSNQGPARRVSFNELLGGRKLARWACRGHTVQIRRVHAGRVFVGTLMIPSPPCHLIHLRRHPRQGHHAGQRNPPRSNGRGLRGPADSIQRTQPQNDLCGLLLLHSRPSRDPYR